MPSASRTPFILAPSFGVRGRASNREIWAAVAFMILVGDERRRRLALSRLRYYAFSLRAGRCVQAAARGGGHGRPARGGARRARALARAPGQSHQRLRVHNRCMLAALRASKGRFKGIARVRPGADERTLAELGDAGVIGLRLDLLTDGVDSL